VGYSDYFSQTFNKTLVTGHPGDSMYESYVNSYLWWPGLDKAIESQVKQLSISETGPTQSSPFVHRFGLTVTIFPNFTDTNSCCS